MENFTTDINFIIIRYLDGSASLEEKRQLLQWLKESEKNRSDFTDTRDLWLSCNASADNELEVDIALDRLKMRIMNEHERIGKKTRRSFIRWYQAAAVLLVLFGLYFWLSIEQTEPKLMVQNQLITAKGSKGKFTLPDGTVVWLNSESRLVYPDQFADGKRTVNLVGGAYFEVVKDEKKPFIVKAGDVDVEVLGTSFNVNDYDGKFVTTLVTGKVDVRVGDENYILDPSMQICVENGNAVLNKVNTNEFTAWKDGLFVFKKQKLQDVLDILSRWYDIVVFYQNADLKELHFTGTIERHNDIAEVVKFLEKTDMVNFTINGKTLVVSK